MTSTVFSQDLEDRITNIQNTVEDIKINIKGKERVQSNIKSELDKMVNRKFLLDEQIAIDTQSVEVFKSVVDNRNASAKEKIESMLNFALSHIPLENQYTLTIDELNTKRSGREFSIKLLDKKANKLRGIRTQSGTAVAQLISFLMRVVVISFSGARRLLVIDENLSGFQDKETIRMFGEILVSLAKNEDFQIIMVEHKSEFNSVPGLHNYQLEKPSYKEGLVLNNILTASPEE